MNESELNWHRYFIDMAFLVAGKSKDRSTRVGAVIIGPDNEVRSTGYNGFPRGVDDDVNERHERPTKYLYTEHAERNAIFNAARHGVALAGCRLYLNSEPCPCADCTRAIIQSGIKMVIGPNITFPGKGDLWIQQQEAALNMLKEGGVSRTIITEWVVTPSIVSNDFLGD